MKVSHILSTQQFLDADYLSNLFNTTTRLKELDKLNKLPQSLNGKVLATIFYEPSTRTRFSFEVAIQKLGGMIITTESASHFSSVTKGESLPDTIRVISGYVDGIILRHNEQGSALIAAKHSSIPIINAGDGSGEHPTQALLDLYTIQDELGNFENLTVALVGDLLYGRTIHSLIYLLSLYKKTKLYLVSPIQLSLPQKYKNYLAEHQIDFEELQDLELVLNKIDVLYVTRVQKERFSTQKEYENLRNSFVITKNVLRSLKKKSIIMHPLPRVNEISSDVDNDKRAAYFRQAKNGVYLRIALLQDLYSK